MEKGSRFLDKQTAVFERLLPGPISRAWDYLTKKEFLATWLAEGDIGAAGSRYALDQDNDRVPMRMPGRIVGIVKVKEPPHKLVITWAGAEADKEDPPEESLVTFALKEQGRDVLLTITHEKITAGFLALVASGWDTHGAVLLAVLKGEPRPQPFPIFKGLLPGYIPEAEKMGDVMGEMGRKLLESKTSQ
jgi:uncharacterized protein YndB with AHSA1/START domain